MTNLKPAPPTFTQATEEAVKWVKRMYTAKSTLEIDNYEKWALEAYNCFPLSTHMDVYMWDMISGTAGVCREKLLARW